MKQFLLIGTLVFFLSSTSKAQQLVSPESQQSQQPASFSDDWYQQAIVNLQSLEQDFYKKNEDDYRAVNSASRVEFTVNKYGYSVKGIHNVTEKNSWFADFRLEGIGREQFAGLRQLPLRIEKQNGKLIYHTKNAAIEYINSKSGMRQNFVINHKPSGKGLLKVKMNIHSNLAVHLANDNLSFYDAQGEAHLSYSDLKVWDANLQPVKASMEFNSKTNELLLVADDCNAIYPLTIDPINQAPEWNTSVDGLLAGLLSNLQMKTALYGFTVTALGDVNGDGFGDAAISAPALIDIFSGTGTKINVGAVFVFHGSALGLSPTPARTLQPTTAVAGALFGFSVAAGDVTGDGINDIIVGAPLDKYSVTVPALIGSSTLSVTAGKVYVYQGNSSAVANPAPLLTIKLGNSFFGQGILGLLSNIDVNALFGFSVAVTDDLNGDSKQDVIVGAPAYAGIDLLTIQSGNAFVYYSNNLSTTSPVELQVPTPSLLGLVQLPLINSSSLLFGYSVDGVGDYNSDGFADVIVGAPAGIDLSTLGGLLNGKVLGGSAYIFYGNGAGINPAIGAKLQGSASGLLANAADLFGFAVKGVRNKNGVHTGSVVVSAPTGGLVANALSLSIQTGNIQLFKKQSTSPSSVVVANQVIESPKSSSLLQLLGTMHLNVLFGASVDNAYDINCDGYPDLVVGEPLSTGTNISQLQASAVGGSAYIYYGLSDGTYNSIPMYAVTATYGSDILSVNATALFGFSVAGIPKIQGSTSKPRIIVGSPSGALDFNSSLLNLGATLGVLFDFAAGNNGLGKAYTFDPQLCGSIHTLPVKLTNFTGQGIDKKVFLNWRTTLEADISEYVVEKSTDGKNFSTLAYVFAKGGNGTNTYEMIDYHPINGVNFYRLRIVGTDKEFTYSPIIKVKFGEEARAAMGILPNPVMNDYKVKLSSLEAGTYTLEIKNNQGQLLLRKNIEITESETVINMTKTSAMSPGVYSIQMLNSENKQVGLSRFVVK